MELERRAVALIKRELEGFINIDGYLSVDLGIWGGSVRVLYNKGRVNEGVSFVNSGEVDSVLEGVSMYVAKDRLKRILFFVPKSKIDIAELKVVLGL